MSRRVDFNRAAGGGTDNRACGPGAEASGQEVIRAVVRRAVQTERIGVDDGDFLDAVGIGIAILWKY